MSVPTWKQFFRQAVDRIVVEYACSREDAEPGAQCELATWQALVIAALRDGWIPEQAWINAVNADEGSAYWWRMRVCHDHPDVFDRIARAGRSMFMTLAQLDAKAESMAHGPGNAFDAKCRSRLTGFGPGNRLP